MTYKPETAEQWRAEAGVFSRALRGLADRWDQALTNGASPEDLWSIISEVDDIAHDMTHAMDQFPMEPV